MSDDHALVQSEDIATDYELPEDPGHVRLGTEHLSIHVCRVGLGIEIAVYIRGFEFCDSLGFLEVTTETVEKGIAYQNDQWLTTVGDILMSPEFHLSANDIQETLDMVKAGIDRNKRYRFVIVDTNLYCIRLSDGEMVKAHYDGMAWSSIEIKTDKGE